MTATVIMPAGTLVKGITAFSTLSTTVIGRLRQDITDTTDTANIVTMNKHEDSHELVAGFAQIGCLVSNITELDPETVAWDRMTGKWHLI